MVLFRKKMKMVRIDETNFISNKRLTSQFFLHILVNNLKKFLIRRCIISVKIYVSLMDVNPSVFKRYGV
jgi:hypothetical protein